MRFRDKLPRVKSAGFFVSRREYYCGSYVSDPFVGSGTAQMLR